MALLTSSVPRCFLVMQRPGGGEETIEVQVKQIHENLVNDFSRGYDGQTVREVRIEGEVLHRMDSPVFPSPTYPPEPRRPIAGKVADPIEIGGIPPEVILTCSMCGFCDSESTHVCSE